MGISAGFWAGAGFAVTGLAGLAAVFLLAVAFGFDATFCLAAGAFFATGFFAGAFFAAGFFGAGISMPGMCICWANAGVLTVASAAALTVAINPFFTNLLR
jgi:hypothetical protein